jgi:hypothetical protein
MAVSVGDETLLATIVLSLGRRQSKLSYSVYYFRFEVLQYEYA